MYLTFALLFTSWLLLPRAAATEEPAPVNAYPNLEWTDIVPVFQNPKSLDKSQMLAFKNVTFTKNLVIFSAAKGKADIFRIHDIRTNEGREWKPDIRGVWDCAYDESANEVLLRTSSELAHFDAETFELKSRHPFKRWRADRRMAVLKNGILVPEGNKIHLLDKKSGETQKTITLSRNKAQRIFRCTDEEIYVWSSYWGNVIIPINAASMTEGGEMRALFHHRSLWKAAGMGSGRIGVYNAVKDNYAVRCFRKSLLAPECPRDSRRG